MRRATYFVALTVLTLSAALHAVDGLDRQALRSKLASKTLLLSVARAGTAIVAVGARGHVVRSTDEGRTWVQSRSDLRVQLTAVFFHDAQLGWAVGHDGSVLRTRDGGKIWRKMRFNPADDRPLLDVRFSTASKGMAVGAYGFLLRSTDAGASWKPGQVSEDDFHLNRIARAPDGTLYLAAEAGNLYRSQDGGVTWKHLPSPYEGSFFGVLPLGGGKLLAYGLRGHLFRSVDGGHRWKRVKLATEATLTQAVLLPNRDILLVGLEGTLLRSRDLGHTFKSLGYTKRHGLMDVLALDDGALLLVGEQGVERFTPARETAAR